MNEILGKLNIVKDKIILDKGNESLRLLALIRRYDVVDKWDLILSADWVEASNKESDLIYVINLLKQAFDNNLDFLSQIVILPLEEIFIQQLAKSVIEQGLEDEPNVLDLNITEGITVGEIHFLYFDVDEEDILPQIKESKKMKPEANTAPNF